MKNIYLFFGLMFIISIIGIGKVEGATYTPTSGITIPSGNHIFAGDSTTFYYINDTSNTGAIKFNESNTYLDCNNTNLINDGNLGGAGFYMVNKVNITVVNCKWNGVSYLNNATQPEVWINNSNIWQQNITHSTIWVKRLWINGVEYSRGYNETTLNVSFPWFMKTSTNTFYLYSLVNPSTLGNITHPKASYAVYIQNVSNLEINGGIYSGSYLRNLDTQGLQDSRILNTNLGSNTTLGVLTFEQSSTLPTKNLLLDNITVDAEYKISNSYNTYHDDNIRFGQGSYNITLQNSLIKDGGHSGIYLLGSVTNMSSNGVENITIRNNYVSGEGSSYFRCFNIDGFYDKVRYNTLINNTCYNTTINSQINGNNNSILNNLFNVMRYSDRVGKTSGATGISISAYFTNASAIDNIISNNIFANIPGPCIIIQNNASSNFVNNTLINCSTNSLYFQVADISIDNYGFKPALTPSLFTNTSFSRAIGIIYLRNTNASLIYEGNYPINLTIQGPYYALATHNNYKKFYLSNYNGVFSFAVINGNTQYPYNDIKNTSTNSILSSNVDNFSISLSPNQQIEVGDLARGCIVPSDTFITNSTAVVLNNSNFNDTDFTAIYHYRSTVIQGAIRGAIGSSFQSAGKLGSLIPIILLAVIVGSIFALTYKFKGNSGVY